MFLAAVILIAIASYVFPGTPTTKDMHTYNLATVIGNIGYGTLTATALVAEIEYLIIPILKWTFSSLRKTETSAPDRGTPDAS